MENFKISENLMKKLDGILSDLTSKYSETELLTVGNFENTQRCDCGGGCAGSCAGRCGGCGGSSCKGGCGGFVI